MKALHAVVGITPKMFVSQVPTYSLSIFVEDYINSGRERRSRGGNSGGGRGAAPQISLYGGDEESLPAEISRSPGHFLLLSAKAVAEGGGSIWKKNVEKESRMDSIR